MGWEKRLKSFFNVGRGRVRGAPSATVAATDFGRPDAGARRSAESRSKTLLPHFHATASDQLDRRVSQDYGSARLRLRTAFTPAQPVTTPNLFAGRTVLLRRLISALEDERLHAIIYGERGIGKTSLLQVLMQMASDAKYQVAYVTCGASASFEDTFRAIAADIPLLFHDAYGPTSSEAERGASLADLLPQGEISPRLASEYCAKVVGTRVLVVLDEFDRVENKGFSRDVAEFLKNLSDRSVRVQLVVAGVASDLEDLLATAGLIQRNVVAIEVPKMTADEIGQLVENGAQQSGIKFDPRALAALSFASDGMPYIATLLCQRAGLNALSQSRLQVAFDDVRAAIRDAARDVGGRISRRARSEITDLVRSGTARKLSPVFSAAQSSGRLVSARQVESALNSPIRAREALVELDRLADEGVLLAKLEEGPEAAYRFFDENGLLFLWLLSIDADLVESRAPVATA